MLSVQNFLQEGVSIILDRFKGMDEKQWNNWLRAITFPTLSFCFTMTSNVIGNVIGNVIRVGKRTRDFDSQREWRNMRSSNDLRVIGMFLGQS